MFDSALYLCPARDVKLEKHLDVCAQGKRASKITLSRTHDKYTSCTILLEISGIAHKSSSCQERLISLSPNLVFRTTPFYFVTFSRSAMWIAVYAAKGNNSAIRPSPREHEGVATARDLETKCASIRARLPRLFKITNPARADRGTLCFH